MVSETMQDGYITATEAAARLGISRGRLYAIRDRLSPVPSGGGVVRPRRLLYPIAAIERELARRALIEATVAATRGAR